MPDTVAPVLADLDRLPELGVSVRLRTLAAAQAQCRREIAAESPGLASPSHAERLSARRRCDQIVRAYLAIEREIVALGGDP